MVGCKIAKDNAVSLIVCAKGYYLATKDACKACTDTSSVLR